MRVFNVGNDLANTGMDALQVLENVPSLTIDQDGNVELRGSANVRILIDGKPSSLLASGTDGLRQIPANLLEKVEIITNPSARYDAEGEAGIINIVLKEEKDLGLNGSVKLQTGYPNNHGFTGVLNWNPGKFNFFSSYGFMYRKMPGERNSDKPTQQVMHSTRATVTSRRASTFAEALDIRLVLVLSLSLLTRRPLKSAEY